jgi:hypothetical protein
MDIPIKQMLLMARGYSVNVVGFLNSHAEVRTLKEVAPKKSDVDFDLLSASVGRVPILEITPSELEIERAVLGIHHRDFFV